MSDSTKSLRESVAEAFVRAVRRVSHAKPVVEQDGTRKKVSQKTLATGSGVARSGIAKLLSEEKDANPTLTTICRIADGLGVPPALLLMRDRDWKVLASAIFSHAEFAESAAFREFAERMADSADHSPSQGDDLPQNSVPRADLRLAPVTACAWLFRTVLIVSFQRSERRIGAPTPLEARL